MKKKTKTYEVKLPAVKLYGFSFKNKTEAKQEAIKILFDSIQDKRILSELQVKEVK